MKNPDKKFFEDMEARQREFAIKLAASTAATNAAENKKGLGDSSGPCCISGNFVQFKGPHGAGLPVRGEV